MLHVLKEEMRPASSRASTCVHCNSEYVRDANYSQLLLLLRHGPLRRGTDSAVPQLPQRPIRLAPVPAVPQARAPCSMRHATLVRRNWRLKGRGFVVRTTCMASRCLSSCHVCGLVAHRRIWAYNHRIFRRRRSCR